MPTLDRPSYFIRFRGQVTGPIATTELRKMAHRGGLARFHELSADGRAWAPAFRFDGLFAPETPPAAPPLTESAAVVAAAGPPKPEPRFYYPRGGATIGPIDAATLRIQVERGSVHATDPIWLEGAKASVMASELPALAGLFPNHAAARGAGSPLMLWSLVAVVVLIALGAVVLFFKWK